MSEFRVLIVNFKKKLFYHEGREGHEETIKLIIIFLSLCSS